MSTEETQLSPKTARWITAIAILAAAAPHAFFAPPLQLHMEGQLQAWLGIAVWAPAILAGVAFFFGVEFGSRNDARAESVDPATRSGAVIGAMIAFLVLAAALHVDRFSDMGTMRPWAELKTALPLFAGLGVLRAVFWQGFVQNVVLRDTSTGLRVTLLAVLELLVVVPFLASGNTSAVASGLLPLVAGEALLAALSHELGYSVRVTLLVRAAAGLAFIWFQQATLL